MVSDPSLSFKHAFVTGATGIVGVPLCRKLAEKSAKVTAFSRSAGVFEFPAGVEGVGGDILDKKSLRAATENSDVIFHVAAAVHGSAKSSEEFERVNVLGTENVIEIAKEIGAKLVYVSSVNVAGFRSGELEDPYAATKSQAESLVEEAASAGLDAVVVRPATVFGAEPGRAGLIVDRLLSGSLKILPAPSRMISPVWSDDLADALIAAGNTGDRGSVYTVAGPSMTTGEFVASVCRARGLRKPLLSMPAWMIAIPLQIAWWLKGVTQLTPPVSIESLLHGSTHDGSRASQDLGIEYTPIEKIFS